LKQVLAGPNSDQEPIKPEKATRLKVEANRSCVWYRKVAERDVFRPRENRGADLPAIVEAKDHRLSGSSREKLKSDGYDLILKQADRSHHAAMNSRARFLALPVVDDHGNHFV